MTLERIPLGVKLPLNEAFKKVNEVIDAADQAKADSSEALNTANEAKSTADSTKAEFDQVVIDGDSSVEAAQARVDADGESHTTLKERLDVEHNEVTSQLAQTEAEVENVQEVKMDKDTTDIGIFQINKTRGLIDETYLSDTLKAQMIENTQGFTVVPKNRSINLTKVTFSKVVSNNLFNEDTAKSGYYISDTTGEEVDYAGFWVSDFISVKQNMAYRKSGGYRYAFYDANKTFISGGASDAMLSPSNAVYLRVSFTDSQVSGNSARVNEGTTLLPFDPYREIISKEYTEKHDLKQEDVPPLRIEKLSFVEKSTNFFDKSKAKLDYYVSGNTGNEIAGEGFVVSDYIPIGENIEFIIKTIRHVAYYDKNKVFLSGVHGQTQDNFTDTTLSETAYVRFSWYPPGDATTVEDQQMNLGNVLLPYEPFGGKIPRRYLDIPQGGGELEIKSVLPPKIHAVIGQEINIYFENTLNVPKKDVFIDVECEIGKHEEKRWTVTPNAIGNYPITISIYINYEMVNQIISNVIVTDSSVGGTNRNTLIIGDSTINNQYMLSALLDKVATENLTLTLYGTRGSGDIKHEGRGGWTSSDFRSDKTYQDAVNPFYNNDFDFNYYMTNQTYPALDYVGICLGINDVFYFKSDESVLNGIPQILDNFDYMINSIKSYDSNIKVGVFVTIPPNSSQDVFGEYRGTGQNQWRYKRNNALWIDALVNHYKGKESQGIYLIPDNSNIDTETGFSDHVHPNETIGDVQRADTLFYWLKSFEV